MYSTLKETILLSNDPYSSFLEHFKNNDYSIMDDAKYLNDFLTDSKKVMLSSEKLYSDLRDEYNIRNKMNLIKEGNAISVFNQANMYYKDDFEDEDEDDIFTDSVHRKVDDEKKGKLKFILDFIKKTISLSAEDLEATNKLRFKALRMALGLFIIGGTLLMPGGLLMNLVKVIVVSSVAVYSAARLSKLQDMLETQVERLEARMEEEDDPKVKAELSFAIKGINKELKKVEKRREQMAKAKRVGRKDKSDKEDW